MDIVERKVRPDRMRLTSQSGANKLKQFWWQYYHPAKDLYSRLASQTTALACSQTSKYLSFARLPSTWLFSQKVVVIAAESDAFFGTVQSSVHQEWADFVGSSMKDDPVYTPSDCFETFPFPENF